MPSAGARPAVTAVGKSAAPASALAAVTKSRRVRWSVIERKTGPGGLEHQSARPALREEPTYERRRPVRCVPHVVIHPQYLEILNRRADSLEGRRSLTRLLYWNRPVDLTMDDPRRDPPQLTRQRFEGWAAIRGNDR